MRFQVSDIPLLASPPRSASALARSLKEEEWLRHRENSAKLPKQTPPWSFSFLFSRKTTPSALPADASRHFLTRAATPPFLGCALTRLRFAAVMQGGEYRSPENPHALCQAP